MAKLILAPLTVFLVNIISGMAVEVKKLHTSTKRIYLIIFCIV